LKIPVAEHGKPCIAGRLREAEGSRPYRLRYKPHGVPCAAEHQQHTESVAGVVFMQIGG